MGNQSHQIQTQHKVIYISTNQTISLFTAHLFPHSLDGLRLWDAEIILARYLSIQRSLLIQKNVLELGAGVGLAGIYLKLFLPINKLFLTDYKLQVLKNLKRNVQLSKLSQKEVKVMQFNWLDPPPNFDKVDIIIGSDLFYFGCPAKALYQIFSRYLNKNGVAIICFPQRKGYLQILTQLVQKQVFEIKTQRLEDEMYMQKASNCAEDYPLIGKSNFLICILKKL